MTLPLFGDERFPPGPIRRSLDAKVAAVRAAGAELDDDLAILARSLADRVDAMNATGERRGFVLIASEYRQTRAQLFEAVSSDSGSDGFEEALAAFSATAADDAADRRPAD